MAEKPTEGTRNLYFGGQKTPKTIKVGFGF